MNKLLVQQVKTIYNSLPSTELEKMVNLLVKYGMSRSIKPIGYKCIECTFQFQGVKVTGFGRDDQEATHNCAKNFIDNMVESDNSSLTFLKTILKELKGPETQDPDIELLGQKIGNISIIQNQNYQTVDSLVQYENDQTLFTVTKENLDPNIKACCPHEAELKKEKLKVEHLELRVKLILEENKILKSMLSDQVKQTSKDSNRPQYSTRVEDTRRKSQTRSNSTKVISNKKIPKLNLEILPTYHGKNLRHLF